jgi:hypothetical protein
VRSSVAVLIALALAAPAHAAWRPPVDGRVTRPFDYGPHPFAAGRHRGADFAAPTASRVRSVCGGRVVFAGTAGRNGGVVTVRCGRRRVTHLPLATLAVHAGARVDTGDALGTLAASHRHAGVHVGVRRAGDAFGYVDPLRFIRPTSRPAPLVPHAGPRVTSPRAPRLTAPRAAPAYATTTSHRDGPPAAAWAGGVAVLVGLAGGLKWRPRRRHVRKVAPREEVRSLA